MDKANLLKCLNHVKDNIDRADIWNKDVLFETIAYIETDGGATVPCSDWLSCRDEIVEKLIKLAAEMATRQGMPSEYVEDWPIPKSTPQKTLNEIERNMEIIQKKIAD